jgi:AcrR family transcriptional regulator
MAFSFNITEFCYVLSMARAPIGRQQFLDAARAELIEGDGTLELSALKRRTGLSTGALYHHFGSKLGLIAAIYEDFYERLKAAVADAYVPADGTWAERERARTGRMVEFHYGDPLSSYLLNRAAPDAGLVEAEDAYITSMGEAAAANIRRGQAAGELSDDIDAASAGAYIIGGLRHAIGQQLRADPRPTTQEATDRLWRLVAASLGIG